eukprot:Hpha_TRINITY_DN10631_c0_g1::TRINITY_DN10631_c0_g1_i1::g.156746::m.156746
MDKLGWSHTHADRDRDSPTRQCGRFRAGQLSLLAHTHMNATRIRGEHPKGVLPGYGKCLESCFVDSTSRLTTHCRISQWACGLLAVASHRLLVVSLTRRHGGVVAKRGVGAVVEDHRVELAGVTVEGDLEPSRRHRRDPRVVRAKHGDGLQVGEANLLTVHFLGDGRVSVDIVGLRPDVVATAGVGGEGHRHVNADVANLGVTVSGVVEACGLDVPLLSARGGARQSSRLSSHGVPSDTHARGPVDEVREDVPRLGLVLGVFDPLQLLAVERSPSTGLDGRQSPAVGVRRVDLVMARKTIELPAARRRDDDEPPAGDVLEQPIQNLEPVDNKAPRRHPMNVRDQWELLPGSRVTRPENPHLLVRLVESRHGVHPRLHSIGTGRGGAAGRRGGREAQHGAEGSSAQHIDR